jgi:hypothetical protein
MSPSYTTIPRFSKDAMVRFAGAVGRIKSYQPHSSTWIYAVEMEMGAEPDFGRVGPETTLLLDEADIEAY